ncbi:1558_t:CDS:1, partial [Scutellospora calospora]
MCHWQKVLAWIIRSTFEKKHLLKHPQEEVLHNTQRAIINYTPRCQYEMR